MELPQFSTSMICQHGIYCRTCRDKEKGRDFRSRMALKYSFPDAPDFACARLGLPFVQDTPATPLAATMASDKVAGVIQAIPRSQRPLWVKLVTQMAIPGEVGIGSVLHRLAGTAGIAIEELLKRMGINCGCNARREALDQKYPLSPPDSTKS